MKDGDGDDSGGKLSGRSGFNRMSLWSIKGLWKSFWRSIGQAMGTARN
jgi:hypothetical protein